MRAIGRQARLISLLAMSMLLATSGCARMINFSSAERRNQGYTVILTGIEGAHVGHTQLIGGLKAGGVPSEIEVVDWTTGTPALMLVHLRYEGRNRRKAEEIAAKITAYQDEYPGRPVNIIGHSGGGGMTLLTLEALPENRSVDSAILLAAAISPEYDLRPVLPKVERGIWNFSSAVGDSPLLVAGTTTFGTIDGRHMPSAGAVGFRLPVGATTTERQMYAQKLFERPYNLKMATAGNLGDHYGCMNYFFVRNEIAPILRGARYPNDTRSLDELMTTDRQFDRPTPKKNADDKAPADPQLPEFRFSE